MSNFFARYQDKIIPEPNSGCWLWTGANNSNGYGVIYRRIGPRGRDGRRAHKQLFAHRLAFEAMNGAAPSSLFILHHCDNACCVNPDHLYSGTHQDNSNDKVRRGRQYKPRAPNAKLTADDVLEIRKAYNGKGTGHPSNARELAKRFGVTVFGIKAVLENKTWKWL